MIFAFLCCFALFAIFSLGAFSTLPYILLFPGGDTGSMIVPFIIDLGISFVMVYLMRLLYKHYDSESNRRKLVMKKFWLCMAILLIYLLALPFLKFGDEKCDYDRVEFFSGDCLDNLKKYANAGNVYPMLLYSNYLSGNKKYEEAEEWISRAADNPGDDALSNKLAIEYAISHCNPSKKVLTPIKVKKWVDAALEKDPSLSDLREKYDKSTTCHLPRTAQ